jgi:hypothetical protein
VSKRGLAHMRQTSLTQVYKNVFLDTKSASVPAVTALRSSLSMYVVFYVTLFFLIAYYVNSSREVTFRMIFVISVPQYVQERFFTVHFSKK